MTVVTGDWLTDPRAQRVFAMLGDAGHRAYAVGGCVRNALLGAGVTDVDISTDALPQRVMQLAEQAGLKAVPTGIDHGTVTVVVDGEGFEITTFRADVETDGRRAVVRFSSDIQEDALRRDFTMNALYADATGRVTDPLGGLPDLQARRVRFIEDAGQRIREDYLRTLRFFRFSAWYGDPAGGFDPDALAAIAGTLEGLDSLSRERVGAEITKLLSAPDPAPAVAVMAQLGVLMQVLPGAVPDGLAPLVHHEGALHLPPDPVRRLAVMGYSDGAALRLSKAAQRQLGLYQSLMLKQEPLSVVAWRHGADIARDVQVLFAASVGQSLDAADTVAISKGAAAVFPILPVDLMPALQGPALGEALHKLQALWIASGFSMDRAALLRALPPKD